MLTSRGLSLLKASCRNNRLKNSATNLQFLRSSHGPSCYREITPRQTKYEIAADVVGGFMWWWMLWHTYHDFGHIVGHFEYPDPSKWTDAELGIPPEDED